MKSIWKEIINEFDDREGVTEEGDGVHIDAYETSDPNENGSTIATIKNGIVTYRDNRAATDPLAIEKIQEVVKEQILELAATPFENGRVDTNYEWFEVQTEIEEKWKK